MLLGLGIAGPITVAAAPPLSVQESLAAPVTEPGASLAVFLITVGAGEARESRFGHSAIRILDRETGADRAFTFGQSHFERSTVLAHLVHGRVESGSAEVDAAAFLEHYEEQGRSIRIQALNLSPAERVALQEILRTRTGGFRYDFLRANCTTKLRDALDEALGGRLREATQGLASPRTPRRHLEPYTGSDPVFRAATGLSLSGAVDRPISAWEEMFLPVALSDRLRETVLTDASGREVPLVGAEELREGSRGLVPERRRPVGVADILAGLLIGGALAGLGAAAPSSRRARRGFVVLAGGWSVFVGLAGLYLLTLATSSQVALAGWNGNLLVANPLFLIVAVTAWGSRPNAERAGRLARLLALVGVVAVGVAALTDLGGGHGTILALAVPVHLGLAWGFRRPQRLQETDTTA